MTLPTDVTSAPNYTATEHATHHNEIHTHVNAGGTAGTWTTWSPTLGNLTLGNGSVLARYAQIGKVIHYRFAFTLGSTSAVGTNPTFTLPVAEVAGYVADAPLGEVTLRDDGTAVRNGYVRWSSSGVAMVISWDTNNQQASITSTVPFTWATNDVMSCVGTYEAA